MVLQKSVGITMAGRNMDSCALELYPTKIHCRHPGVTDSDPHHIRFIKT